MMTLKTSLLSTVALIAFAGNSVLCRLALANGTIDPASFTSVRLMSGAVTLLLLVLIAKLNRQHSHSSDGDSSLGQPLIKAGWLGPLSLFVYAALFSFAYITLDTGVGALILFGFVQITMIGISVFRGNRPSLLEIAGLSLACSGLVYLVYPELSTPSVTGFVMMAFAGIGWGLYTVNGQGSLTPLRDTASNFVKAAPFAILLAVIFFGASQLSAQGLMLAIASGAITSGMGYAVWYAALRDLSSTQAGVLQLLVPIIAAVGGVLFANEALSSRLIISATLTLGGILIVMLAKEKKRST